MLLLLLLQPKVCNEFGSCNNQVTVKQSDFEVFEALAVDGADGDTSNSWLYAPIIYT